MRELLPGLWYHVRTDAPDGAQATAQTSLEAFAEMLPHGSGLDADWFVSFRRGGRGLTLTTEWHAMNETGDYCGWYPVRVVLDRDKADGALSVRSVRVNERATNGAGDYLADLMTDVCRAANGGGA